MAKDWELKHERHQQQDDWRESGKERLDRAEQRHHERYAKQLAAAEQFGFALGMGDPNAFEDYRAATGKMTIIPVAAQDADNALIYRDGILDYEQHDAFLRFLGYQYFGADLPCTCAGNDDDGHMPCCGWGKVRIKLSPAEVMALREDF